jgi:hypothetical protein
LIRKPVNELHFVRSREPMSTVEIDLDTLPEESFGYAQLVESALAPLAAADPRISATVYVYQGPSVNFGNYGYSAFFAVAGDRRVLGALYASFSGARGLKTRYSDHIQQSQALCQYHIEEGLLWRPDEGHVWYASTDDEADEGEAEGVEEDEDDVDVDDEGWEEDEADLEGGAALEGSRSGQDVQVAAPPVRTELPARFRAARSDASVGSICRSIEAVFGLPEGSVALRGPEKKALRSDASIRTLRKRWE